MDSIRKEKIKLKITALLSKTTQNGASESESLLALKKAQDLMLQYAIEEDEISDSSEINNFISLKVPLDKMHYDHSYLFNALARLFDTKAYLVPKEYVVFFGEPADVEMCSYFYNYFIRVLKNEMLEFKKSTTYKIKTVNGRTLMSSFVKGFTKRINVRTREMYDYRTKSVSEKVGLVLQRKELRVNNAFLNQDLNLTTSKIRASRNTEAFNHGSDRGKEVTINQGVDASKHIQRNLV